MTHSKPTSPGSPEGPAIVLLTGFEPFGSWDANPSWQVAALLDGREISGARVAARPLPVDWTRAWPVLSAAIEEIRPRWILMLGLAGKRASISIEAYGRNECRPLADNAGVQPLSSSIDADGPASIAVSLPVDLIARRLNSLGLPVECSEDAGGYLCNFVLYKTLSDAGVRQMGSPTGFIHLPPLLAADAGSPELRLEDMVRAVEAAIATIVEPSVSKEVGPTAAAASAPIA